MNEEQIEKLIDDVTTSSRESSLIREWFKENYTETAVGLSNEHIEALASHLAIVSDGLCTFYEREIHNWLDAHTFILPEVKEISSVKETPEGLSEPQIKELSIMLFGDNRADFKIYQWLKTQKFKLPLEPNWDSAPKRAVEALLLVRYFDDCGMCCLPEDVLLHRVSRPAAEIIVEANQVWERGATEVIVLGLGKENDLDTVCFKYLDDEGLQIEPLDKFRIMFNLVA